MFHSLLVQKWTILEPAHIWFFFKSFSIYIEYKSEIKYDWKIYFMCHNRIRNKKMRSIKREMQKTISNDNFLFYTFGD